MKILLKERRRREGQGSNYSSKKKHNSYRRKSTTTYVWTGRVGPFYRYAVCVYCNFDFLEKGTFSSGYVL